MQSIADHALREALEAAGHRLTGQRAAVYRYLRDARTHPGADEVYTHVRTQIADISLATVYKALETLVGCGLATKLAFGNGSARYDARMDDHCHAYCDGCGSVRDVPNMDSVSLSRPFGEVGGFEVHQVRVELIGLCAGCRG